MLRDSFKQVFNAIITVLRAVHYKQSIVLKY